MSDKKYIFYGYGCGEKDALKFCRDHDIILDTYRDGERVLPRIFIDPEGLPKDNLNAALQFARSDVVVVVTNLAQLGHGAKANQMKRQFETTGATVLVPERVLQKRGPKPTAVIPEAFEARAQALYDNKANSRQFVCDEIFRLTGVRMSRGQLARRFETK